MQSEAFFDDFLFKIIYSCHMALFMLISGYLFGASLRKHDWHSVLASRLSSLVLPLLSWGVVGVLAAVLHYHGAMPLFKSVVSGYLHGMWFIWAILYNSLLVLLVKRFGKDNLCIYFVLYLALFVTPDGLNFALYKYMYPFFLCGYMAYKFDLMTRLSNIVSHKCFLFAVCTAGYVWLMQFFAYESYIYTSHYSIVNFKAGSLELWKMGNDIYRMVTAFAGSILVLSALHFIWHRTKGLFIWRYIASVGRASLAIYLFSGELVFAHVLPKVMLDASSSYSLNFLETVLILCMSYLVYLAMKNIRFLDKLFLGGR